MSHPHARSDLLAYISTLSEEICYEICEELGVLPNSNTRKLTMRTAHKELQNIITDVVKDEDYPLEVFTLALLQILGKCEGFLGNVRHVMSVQAEFPGAS